MALLDQTRIIQKQSDASERRVSFVNKQKIIIRIHITMNLFLIILSLESPMSL